MFWATYSTKGLLAEQVDKILKPNDLRMRSMDCVHASLQVFFTGEGDPSTKPLAKKAENMKKKKKKLRDLSPLSHRHYFSITHLIRNNSTSTHVRQKAYSLIPLHPMSAGRNSSAITPDHIRRQEHAWVLKSRHNHNRTRTSILPVSRLDFTHIMGLLENGSEIYGYIPMYPTLPPHLLAIFQQDW